MNLKNEGIKKHFVFATELNKQLRIGGQTKIYPVYDISLDCLYYNDQNDRIATWMSKYRSEHNVDTIDMTDIASYNDIIEEFIVDSNRDAMKKTKNNIKLIGQQEYGVVLNDGRIIDGNRRFTCLRQLERETGEPHPFKAVILEHDIENNAKEIKKLELALQMGVDKPVDYDPIDRVVGIYTSIVETGLLTAKEYADSVGKTEREIQNEVEKAKLMVEYLEFINAPKQYHLVKELNLNDPLAELYKMLKRFRDSDDRKEELKNIVFTNFTVQPEGDMTRYIRKIKKITESPKFLNDFLAEQMDSAEKMIDIIDEHEIISEEVINEEIRTDDMVATLEQSTSKWLARTESDASKNQPAQLLEKAYNAIESIDVNVFKKLSEDQLALIWDKISSLEEIIELIKNELD